MTEEQKNQKNSTVKRHSRYPTICLFLLTGLNALFWFTANFGEFVPPSDGPFRERLHLFMLTEAGFFTWVFCQGELAGFILGLVTLVLYISSTFIYRSRILGFVTCIAVFLWFIWGISYAGLRIT